MVVRKKYSFFLFILLILASTVQAQRQTVTEDQGAMLAAEGYYGSRAAADVKYFDPMPKGAAKPFLGYQGIGTGIGETFGFFAVNPWTGDVWSLWSCEKLDSPELAVSKARIRKHFTSDVAYAKYSNMKPDCITD